MKLLPALLLVVPVLTAPVALAAGDDTSHGGHGGNGAAMEHDAHDMDQMNDHMTDQMGDHMDGMDHMSGQEHDEAPVDAGLLGQPGNAADVNRTVKMVMNDTLRFEPASITVKAGETVRFFLINQGSQDHEMILGSMAELREHAEMMRKMPNMRHHAPNMAHLKPGQRGAIVWHFDKPGTVNFACLIPGHMEAGMKGTITVEP